MIENKEEEEKRKVHIERVFRIDFSCFSESIEYKRDTQDLEINMKSKMQENVLCCCNCQRRFLTCAV